MVALCAVAIVPVATSARDSGPRIERGALFVNMRGSEAAASYQIGRYERGIPVPFGPVAVAASDACHLWSPSVIRSRGKVWLFAAEHDCRGWYRVVLYTSNDGLRFNRRAIVFETKDQLRTPLVVVDGKDFHLWYTIDRGGLGRALAYADSRDGLRFVQRGVKLWAGPLTTLAVADVFRLGSGWRLLVQGYNPELTEAEPHLVAFADPRQRTYRYVAPLRLEKAAPKIDASYVCRTTEGRWRGLFTAFGATGDLFAFEWTVAYKAPSLLGPWTVDRDAPTPYLQLWNGGAKASVENPTPVRADAGLATCSR